MDYQINESRSYGHRRSIRLPGFDYSSSGAYYITLCARKRQPIFVVPALHAILEEQWLALPQRFAGIRLDSFVIMPDHVHCIFWIDKKIGTSPELKEVIGAYKSLTATLWIQYVIDHKVAYFGSMWHRNYYEHIIRNEADLMEKRIYIQNNPIVANLKNQAKRSRRGKGQI